jgi:hypothetical protein
LGRDARNPKRWREREPKERILVAIDAEKTEHQYLDQFRRQVTGCLRFALRTRGNSSPSGLAEFAVQQVKGGDFTEVWVVCDEDEYREQGDLQKALQHIRKAQKMGLKVEPVVSSPCFELWLLLHHRTHAADEALHRDEAVLRLLAHVKHYDKTDLKFTDFKAGVEEAVKRARALVDAQPPHSYRNPSTGMGRLIERLTGVDRTAPSR